MKIFYPTFCLLFLLCLLIKEVAAQSIVGTWKRSSLLIEKNDGTKSEAYLAQRKAMPCMETVTYNYMPDGKVVTKAPDCKNMQSMIESLNGKANWKQAGNKVTITSTDSQFPTQTYTVSFSGNAMTWYFNYADSPKTPNPAKAKSMTIVYTKI